MLQQKISCPNCQSETIITYSLQPVSPSSKLITIKGILKCNKCKHERPLTLEGESITEISSELPGQQSEKLIAKVKSDIKEDIKEAERALYNQCYKASVTMCRRALQLSLIDIGIEDKPLSKMLIEAKPKITDSTYNIATSIKAFGDIGAHRRELITPDDAKIAIYIIVKMLNELAEFNQN